jgi:3-oxoacyl-[acyl-carrier-protein] synthase II
VGVVCALGQSIAEFWSNCLAANTVVSAIPDHWFLYSDYKSHIWSVLPNIDFDAFNIRRVDLLKYDRSSILSLCAAKQAVEQSGLNIKQKNVKDRTYIIEGLEPLRTGIFMGTSFGANSFLESHAHQVLSKPKRAMRKVVDDLQISRKDQEAIQSILDTLPHAQKYHPLTASRLMPNAVSAVLGIKYSITGPANTLAMACAAGTAAIGQGFRSIRDGYLDVVIAGGSEYWNDYYGAIFRAFDIANTLVKRRSNPEESNRPFDRDRSGFLFSQGGSGVLIL